MTTQPTQQQIDEAIERVEKAMEAFDPNLVTIPCLKTLLHAAKDRQALSKEICEITGEESVEDALIALNCLEELKMQAMELIRREDGWKPNEYPSICERTRVVQWWKERDALSTKVTQLQEIIALLEADGKVCKQQKDALSIQVAQLSEALKDISRIVFKTHGDDGRDLNKCGNLAEDALSTLPSPSEWVRRDVAEKLAGLLSRCGDVNLESVSFYNAVDEALTIYRQTTERK